MDLSIVVDEINCDKSIADFSASPMRYVSVLLASKRQIYYPNREIFIGTKSTKCATSENLTFLKSSNYKYKRRSGIGAHVTPPPANSLFLQAATRDVSAVVVDRVSRDDDQVLKKSDNFSLNSFISIIIIITVIINRAILRTLRRCISHESATLFDGAAMAPHDGGNATGDDTATLLCRCVGKVPSSSSSSSSSLSPESIKLSSGERRRRYLRRQGRVNGFIQNVSASVIPTLMTLFIALGLAVHNVEAGACWRKNLANGKCNEIFSLNITKSDCCSTSEEFSFTDKELTSVEFFFATSIGGGMECAPCLDSCKNVICGQNKKCAKRRGRPKCICALECGTAAQKHSKFLQKMPRRSGTNNEHFPLANFAKSPRDVRSLSSEILGPSTSMNGGGGGGGVGGGGGAGDSGGISGRKTNQRKSIVIGNSAKLNSGSQRKHISSSTTGVGSTSRRHIVMSVPTVSRHQVISRNKNDKLMRTADDMIRKNSRNNNVEDLSHGRGARRKSNTANTDAIDVVANGNRTRGNDHRGQQQHHQHHGRHQFSKLQQNTKPRRKIKDHNGRAHFNVAADYNRTTNRHPAADVTNNASWQRRNPHQNGQQMPGTPKPTTTTTTSTDQLTFDDRIYNTFYMNGFANPLHELSQIENVRYNHPVCGTDGRTYNTECQLRKRACRTDNTDLVVAYHGHCRTTCNAVKCLNGLTCVEDHYTIPHCISCKIDCPNDDKTPLIDPARAVCGVDGKTYKSTCDINRMVCRIGRSIAVAYPGPCRDDHATCNSIVCGPKMTCLMDLLTQEPRCVSCRFKCSRKRRPVGLRFEEGKICGTNNRPYHSWCELRKDSCSTGFFIDIKSLGDC